MGVAVMPTTLFVSPDGKVVKTLAGTVTRRRAHGRAARGLPGVIDGLFAYAFTTGMLATVNPCGFAMLPAYLSYFLGDREPATGPTHDGGRHASAARWS